MNHFLFLIFPILFLPSIFIPVIIGNENPDLILTSSEKQKLSKFKEIMEPRLPHAYMKEDLYLVRWLRARNFDLGGAERMLLQNLKWRQDNDMDNILKEDWTDMENEYNLFLQGCDKIGRPGQFDLRKAIVAGKGERVKRYFDKLHEEMTSTIRLSQAKGQNITQWDEIYDVAGFNLGTQACPRCIPILIYWFQTYENHFPGTTHTISIINMPQLALTIWNVLRPFLSPHTLETTRIFGSNKASWRTGLLEFIDEKQLTKDLGGVKPRAITLEEFRGMGGYFNCSWYEYQGNN